MKKDRIVYTDQELLLWFRQLLKVLVVVAAVGTIVIGLGLGLLWLLPFLMDLMDRWYGPAIIAAMIITVVAAPFLIAAGQRSKQMRNQRPRND